jgi:thiol-disulfide isomerase/thioredoxin
MATNDTDNNGETVRQGGLVRHLWIGAVAAIAGFLAVYVALRPADNRGDVAKPVASGRATPAAPAAPVPPASPTAAPAPASATPPATVKSAIDPLSTGEMATFVFKKQPEPLPAVRFLAADGKETGLEAFRGRTVLLNLWATWCAPCRKEMPALDRLQKSLGSDKFEVVAVAVDRKGLEGAKAFLDQIKTERLALYADPSARMGSELKAVGMPTTILIDGQGREVGRLVGPAEWDHADAERLIKGVLAR